MVPSEWYTQLLFHNISKYVGSSKVPNKMTIFNETVVKEHDKIICGAMILLNTHGSTNWITIRCDQIRSAVFICERKTNNLIGLSLESTFTPLYNQNLTSKTGWSLSEGHFLCLLHTADSIHRPNGSNIACSARDAYTASIPM